MTKFEIKVYRAVLKIPLGKTRSYKWVAQRIGHPNAFRAVGSALKKNPYPLIIPCHRVIKSNKDLGCYAGGAKFKEKVLKLERQISKFMV